MSSSPQSFMDPIYVISPSKFEHPDTQFFYSVPGSPAPYDPETDPVSPKKYYDAASDLFDDDFKFESSHLFIDYNFRTTQKPGDIERQKLRTGSLPEMAFADELICDGKVMPLKPPPCYQYVSQNSSSVLLSPKSPSSLLKRPFQRMSLWNDDFDPFLAALETVKGSNDSKRHCQDTNTPRRAKSVSPFPIQGHKTEPKQNGTSQSPGRKNVNMESEKPEESCSKRPINLPEPKGVAFARKVSLVKMDNQDWTKEPNNLDDTSEGSKSKRHKNFLFRSRSSRKQDETSGSKKTDRYFEHSQPKIKRELSLREPKVVGYNEIKTGSEVAQMTMVQYKPNKLLLCMGFGHKYVK